MKRGPHILAITLLLGLPMTVRAQGAARPDLRIDDSRVSILDADWQALVLRGEATVTLANYSYVQVVSRVTVLAFDDVDRNRLYSSLNDTLLGEIEVTAPGPWRRQDAVFPLQGPVRFRDSIVSFVVDPSNTISETNEQNNYHDNDPNCKYVWTPLDRNIAGGVEGWRWTGGAKTTPSRYVQVSPLIYDVDNNGAAEVLFASYDPRDIIEPHGLMRGIDSILGSDVFVSTRKVWAIAELAAADLDRDGSVEIIGMEMSNRVMDAVRALIYGSDGTVKTESERFGSPVDWGGASVADLDRDGYGEIVVCGTVLDHSGAILWRGAVGKGTTGDGCHAAVADINLDGSPDVVAGNTVYRNDGTVLWSRESIDDGNTAVGNFDDDLLPEIVLVTSRAQVYLLDSNGSTLWGPVDLPNRASSPDGGGPPTLADFDGDGRTDIGVAHVDSYSVFDGRGRRMWTQPTKDPACRSAASAFDFNADGAYELVYGDEQELRIFDGKTGTVLWRTKRPAGTGYDLPVVADGDRDDQVEIYTGIAAGRTAPETPAMPPGVYSFAAQQSVWAWTRAIWNQLSYHVNNVDDHGILPLFEYPSWLDHNTYRANVTEAYASSVPDLSVSRIELHPIETTRDYRITVRVGNGGGLNLSYEYQIAFFDGDPNGGGELIDVYTVRDKLERNAYFDMPFDDSSDPTERQIVWRAPSKGQHTIYVLADFRDILTECRVDNNVHSASFTIDDTGSVAPTATALIGTAPPVEHTPTRVATSTTRQPPTLWSERLHLPLLVRSRR